MLQKAIFPCALVMGLWATAVLADEAGKEEYMVACAACHGESAMGDGPIAGLMNLSTPDLTRISERNDGAFPMLDVIQVVDGRTGVRAHGGSMPVWGNIFRSNIGDSAGPYGSEMLVRGRILSLVYYLESIQK